MGSLLMRKQVSEYLNRFGARAAAVVERFLPDPWIYAIILTLIAYLAALVFTPATPWRAALAWHEGLWDRSILLLIAQFSINLILCATLARAPLVEKALLRLARTPEAASGAIRLIALVSIGMSLISWSLGIIGGALFARQVCRHFKARGVKIHYPLAVAAGFVGNLTWGCGLTSSAVLISATPGHFLEPEIGVIPASDTLGSWTNLSILGLLALSCPLILSSMHPKGSILEVSHDDPSEDSEAENSGTLAEALETSPLMLKVGALLPLSYFVHYFFILRGGLTIDSMNLLFLVGVLLLYRTPRQMLVNLSRSSRAVWPIVFQFPFYAGLLGLIKTTGLGQVLAQGFVAASTGLTWPATGLVFQGVLNLFVPSGGAQWIISGPILVDTSHALGYSTAQAVMIEVMGDQLTNMIQPLWALPALALAGLQARQVMGYTAVVMFFAFFIMAAGLTLLPA